MQKWLLWTEHQYRLPPVGKAFQELGGKELCAMSEEQFRQRSPLGGDVLHAHLDIWKSGGWSTPHPTPRLQAGDIRGEVRPGCLPAGYRKAAPCSNLGSVLNPGPSDRCLPGPWVSPPAPTLCLP